MKFNLKNRPKLFDPKFASKADDWFLGFEKELREYKGKYGDATLASELKREILGETIEL